MDSACMRQLMLVKYLFQRGEKALDVRSEMAYGVAVSHLQDAVEMLLYAAIKENNLELQKGQRGFPHLWQVVNDRMQPKLPFGHAMVELNNARVAFKHYGTLPAASSVEGFLTSTRRFLVIAMQTIFGQDFESVSLVSLIRDEQIRDILKQAEDHLAKGAVTECMSHCARAHDFAGRHLNKIVPRMSQSLPIIVQYGDDPGTKSFSELANYANVLRDISLAAILDIPASDFFRYASLDQNMPLVIWDTYGDGHGSGNTRPNKTEPDENDVRFALRYVTDYALAIEAHIRLD